MPETVGAVEIIGDVAAGSAVADAGAVTAAEAAAGEIGTTAAIGGAAAGGLTAADVAATAGALGLGGAALGAGSAAPGLTGLAATGANVPASGNAVGGATTAGTGAPGAAPGNTPITGTGGTSAAATSGPTTAGTNPVDLSQLTATPIADSSTQALPGLTSGADTTGGLAPLSSADVTSAAAPTVNSATDTASLLSGTPNVYSGSSLAQLGQAVGNGNIGDIASKAGGVLAANPSTALGALGLGYSALNAGQLPKGANALTSQAKQLGAQGAGLAQSLNGPLPAGAQASLSQASNSAKAAIRSQYAGLGLQGSTMEAEALANVDQTVAAQGFQIADQLYQQGVSETNMSSQLFNQIMQIQASQNNALTGAIGNFAGALAGNGLNRGG